ncbi:MAG: hypothetical protein LBF63_04205, partial [Treponema sp.]|jgi:hypothetical protein|nr:hypothetical protein [Treponema sp.]
MTGGEISDNGSELSALPYSGIYVNCSTPSEAIPHNVVLDGTVAIKNNNVSLLSYDDYWEGKLYLGENFNTADPIQVVLTVIENNGAHLAASWNGLQLLAPLPQHGLAIDATAVGKFVLADNYYLFPPQSQSGATFSCQQIAGYTSRISTAAEGGIPGAGYVVVTEDQ